MELQSYYRQLLYFLLVPTDVENTLNVPLKNTGEQAQFQ